jgi:PHD/YefM family antitoxin component YafN of YafNO toxin-antitoxin module
MKSMTVDEAQVNLDALLDEVCATGEPLAIRRNGSVFVLSTLETFEQDDDTTAYLLRSEANRQALMESIAQSRAGQLIAPDLDLTA